MKKLKLREINKPKQYTDKQSIFSFNNLRLMQMSKHDRNRIERFLDRHNHLMEFIRTLLALVVLGLQLYILTRLIQMITQPIIIDFMHTNKKLDEKYLNKLADLILFYWEFRLDNPNIQLAQA